MLLSYIYFHDLSQPNVFQRSEGNTGPKVSGTSNQQPRALVALVTSRSVAKNTATFTSNASEASMMKDILSHKLRQA